MLDSPLVDHIISVENRDGWAPGYGGNDRSVTDRWLVCDCGWEWELPRHRIDAPYMDVVMPLQHLMNVQIANSCLACKPQKPCASHCPRQQYHFQLGKVFCESCGRRYNKQGEEK